MKHLLLPKQTGKKAETVQAAHWNHDGNTRFFLVELKNGDFIGNGLGARQTTRQATSGTNDNNGTCIGTDTKLTTADLVSARGALLY